LLVATPQPPTRPEEEEEEEGVDLKGVMSSGDKLQRMLERQREREEALKKKEAERANQEAAKKAEVNGLFV